MITDLSSLRFQLLGWGLGLVLAAAGVAWTGQPAEKLPERFRRWLEEEVVYIISPVEKEVFQSLQHDRERELFIQAFWEHRDPTPGDRDNEFRREHLRRINHADRYFGRGTPKPGWKTDRGRIYIILGEPTSIQRLEGRGQVYPSEIWFYQGKTDQGLPPAFNLVFFQESGVGEYRLYSPLADGPQALMTSYFGDPMDYLSAFEELKELAPELSAVSLSLIPGESNVWQGRPSLSSELLVNRVESAPQSLVSTQYARKFLEYKDLVEVEYSTNYIGCDSLVNIRRSPSRVYFVHYAIEPERLSLNADGSRYYTTLGLNGTVTDRQGIVIHQFEKSIPLQFDESQIEQIRHRPVSLRDMFPLVPGRYKLSILLTNEVSKEFTSLERDLVIPESVGEPQMTGLLLGYRMKPDVPDENRLRPFQAGGIQVYFQANRIFTRQDDLILSYQIHGVVPSEERQLFEIRYALFQDDRQVRMISRHPGDYPDLPNVLETFSLADFQPAHYRIRITLLASGRELLWEEARLDITHEAVVPRPWVYSKLLAPTDHPDYAYVLGTQLFRKQEWEKAQPLLEKAFSAEPSNLAYGLGLARLLLAARDYQRIPEILSPLLDSQSSPPFEVYLALGQAYQKVGKPDEALEVFQAAVQQHGLNTLLLNAIGECHYRLGQLREALSAWSRSLELNREQPAIRKLVQELTVKK